MNKIPHLWLLSIILLTYSLPATYKETYIDLAYDLLFAVRDGSEKRCKEILALDASLVNVQLSCNETVLTIAIQKRKIALIAVLLAAGAQVDNQDAYGQTALIKAARNGDTEIVNALLGAHPDVDIQDKFNGCSALMWAVQGGHTEVVQALLNARADITLKEITGKTALDIAHKQGHRAIVTLLRNHVPIEPEEDTIMVKPCRE